jgi:hypothetical protein
MKKILFGFLVVSILMMSAVSGQAAHHGGRGWGPGWGPVVGLGIGLGLWELSRPHYYPYDNYYYSPPIIIQQQPSDVYIEQAPQTSPAPAQEPAYWYYCPDPQGYYPYVKQCPKGWLKVVPTPPAPQ